MTDQAELARVEDEAANWAVLLADDPHNAEQRRAFERWLASGALQARVWERTRRACDGLGYLPVADAGKRAGGNRGWRFPRGWKPLCGVAAALGLALLLLPQLALHLSADVITATGERKTLLLDDGSRLFLAPQSAVDIDYAGRERRVRLLRGRAFFEVRADDARPFRVDSGGVRTTVLGTAFSVDKTDDGAIVSVACGRVRVERNSFPMVSENLRAGDRLSVARGWEARRLRVAAREVAPWRRGELIARDLTVGELVESFRRYYSGAILVAEPLASRRVTGLYRLDDPLTTLTELAEAHGASARLITPWLLVLQ